MQLLTIPTIGRRLTAQSLLNTHDRSRILLSSFDQVHHKADDIYSPKYHHALVKVIKGYWKITGPQRPEKNGKQQYSRPMTLTASPRRPISHRRVGGYQDARSCEYLARTARIDNAKPRSHEPIPILCWLCGECPCRNLHPVILQQMVRARLGNTRARESAWL
jgi:hypothetical protein